MGSLRDFTRVKQVGKGAFGVAWLVEAKSGGRRFVIKELGQKEMSEKERFDARKEVMFLAKMNHPNIVSYYNSFEESDRVHILMEFCENGDLGARIKVQNGILFKEDQILDYFVQICHGIKHIHDNKILHRDIKPQNIFLTKSNVVKLGDFGIAKLMNSTTAFTSTTVGTPFYFSPELCSRRMYNNKSDIWSLGCVLYELCTLNHAFSAQEMAILALRIKNVSYKPISVNYSSGLRFLISSIFQRDPRERPNINEILKKPFIARIVDKSYPQSTPQFIPVKDVNQKRPCPAGASRVDSGLNNRKVVNKENLMANSPYLPPPKKPMIKRQDNNKANALVIKKNEISKRKRAAMIINDREKAWKNVLSKTGESKEEVGKEEIEEVQNAEFKVPGRYDNYYADLERLKQQQELREMEGKQLMHRFHKISDEDISEGIYRKIDHVKNNIQIGINAADRDRLVQEYWDNKQKALHNRNRDGAGVALALFGERKIDIRNVPQASPLNHEEEMSDRLDKIRQHNAEAKKNQNIGDFNLNYDKDRGVILNRDNVRLALEDLQKKIKLRSEELQQKLALKRLEKEKEKEITVENQRKDEHLFNPSSDLPGRPKNVILFPKRAYTFADENKLQNPQMTNILNQIKENKPSEEKNVDGQGREVQVLRPGNDIQAQLNNVDVLSKRIESSPGGDIKDPRITNILEEIKNIKPSGDEIKIPWSNNEDMKIPSLSVILDKLREEPSHPRPSTAPAAEKLEIKKIKTDILKRLNKNQILLDKVKEESPRRSWALCFDDNLMIKDENADNLDNTLSENNTMANVSVITHHEEYSPRQKWLTDHNNIPKMATECKPSKSAWSQNEDFTINMIVNEEELTVEDDLETTVELDNTTVAHENTVAELMAKDDEIEREKISETTDIVEIKAETTDVAELKAETQDIPEDVDDILSVMLERSHDDIEPVVYLTKIDAWEKIYPEKKELKNEEQNESFQSSSSSEDDKDVVSVYMRKVLEIKANNSSEEDVRGDHETEDTTEISDYTRQLSEARSLPDLLQIIDIRMKKSKSEGYLDKNNKEEDFSESEEDEDFSDEKTQDENIFFKIEMIRDKLEREIGLDPLIDAMEFVRESQDLDGDDLASRLRVMMNDNEDAVNDIFHLVVLEEQYNNMD